MQTLMRRRTSVNRQFPQPSRRARGPCRRRARASAVLSRLGRRTGCSSSTPFPPPGTRSLLEGQGSEPALSRGVACVPATARAHASIEKERSFPEVAAAEDRTSTRRALRRVRGQQQRLPDGRRDRQARLCRPRRRLPERLGNKPRRPGLLFPAAMADDEPEAAEPRCDRAAEPDTRASPPIGARPARPDGDAIVERAWRWVAGRCKRADRRACEHGSEAQERAHRSERRLVGAGGLRRSRPERRGPHRHVFRGVSPGKADRLPDEDSCRAAVRPNRTRGRHYLEAHGDPTHDRTIPTGARGDEARPRDRLRCRRRPGGRSRRTHPRPSFRRRHAASGSLVGLATAIEPDSCRATSSLSIGL